MIGASNSTRLGPISDEVRAFRIEDDLRYAREMVEATRGDLLEAFQTAIKTLSDVVGDKRRRFDAMCWFFWDAMIFCNNLAR
jgi:hypothetical protein